MFSIRDVRRYLICLMVGFLGIALCYLAAKFIVMVTRFESQQVDERNLLDQRGPELLPVVMNDHQQRRDATVVEKQ